MLNQIILVGRLTENLEVKEVENGKYAILKLEIPRSFKNADGEYDKDYIAIKTFGSVAENTANYCNKGDIVGVKGRVQSTEPCIIEIIGEKVTFLSSNKKEEDK